MNKKTLTRWFASAALTGALVCSMSPALAGPLSTTPAEPAPTPSATEGPAPEPEQVPMTEPDAATHADEPVAEPQAPGSAPAEPAEPAELVETTEEEAGVLGARMGQGLERLLTTGDPQVPTPEEKQQELDAEAGRLEAPLEVSDTTAGQPPAATSNVFQASPAFAAAQANTWMPPGIQGIDVSSHQGNVDWGAAWRQGSRFAYTKATEGTYYKNPFYNQQYNGAANTGMVRGAYHFAIPAVGSGRQEANFFVDNGGGWSADGRTLPPLLDIEYNPYPHLGNSCYNMSAGQMITWIRDFSNTIQARTGRVPMIYSTTDWWRTCTGNTNAFANHPLHIASYARTPGALPNGWPAYTVWQYSSTGPFVGDSNVFNGNTADLDRFVRNGSSAGSGAISRLAAATPSLGRQTTSVVCGIKNGGCYQTFQNGQIHWSAGTGARVTKGGINALWADTGWEAGPLGYPVSHETCGLDGGGCVQSFEGGNAYWTPVTGPKYTKGAIDSAWNDMGRERSLLGYPTTFERCGLRDGGCVQNFQGGRIHWTPATGARPTSGSLGDKWASLGWEGGTLGYPTGFPTCGLTGGGCYQDYQGGQIHWTGATGAHPTWGAIASTWAASGWEKGSLGYPTSDEICSSTGTCRQKFQHGTLEWIPGRGVVRR